MAAADSVRAGHSPPSRPMAGIRSFASLPPMAKAHSPILLATPLSCTTAQPARGLPFGSTAAAADRALEDIRLPLLGTRIAGHITAFTATTTTIENLVGRITTHLLLSTVGCTLRRTTLMSAAELSSFVTQLITVSPGPMRDRSRAALHSSATSRSPATWPQATCTSPG